MASSTEERRPPAVEDIEAGISGILRGLASFWKFFLVLVLLALTALVVSFIIGLPAMAQGFLLVGSLLFQLLFAIFFMVVQFGALIFFLARARGSTG